MFLITLIVLCIVGFIILTYHRLLAQIDTIHSNYKQIDIQLDRRYKVFETFIQAVKKHIDYETTNLKDVIALRHKAEQARITGNEEERVTAENQISTITTRLSVLFEIHHDLKADPHCLQVQEEILRSENKLTYAIQTYNDSVEMYETSKKSPPTPFIVKMFRSKLNIDFPLWGVGEEKLAPVESFEAV